MLQPPTNREINIMNQDELNQDIIAAREAVNEMMCELQCTLGVLFTQPGATGFIVEYVCKQTVARDNGFTWPDLCDGMMCKLSPFGGAIARCSDAASQLTEIDLEWGLV